jgi:hypothetical protein
MKERKCAKCKEIKLIEEFPRDKQNHTGVKPYCRQCSVELAAEYYKKSKQKRLTAVAEYYKKIKDGKDYITKNSARYLVRELVRKGMIEKGVCYCGDTKTQAHHYAGYEGDNASKVVWLCKIHHERVHHPSPVLNTN